MTVERRVLLVDLNNFARYPTLSIGYLTSLLRRNGDDVRVFAPLMIGVRGVMREPRPHYFSLLATKMNYLAATSSHPWIRHWRDGIAARRFSGITVNEAKVIDGFRQHVAIANPQVVLISTYLMYRDVCKRICAICKAEGIPVVIGGPYFAQPEVIAEWVRIPGLSALIAGEVELQLPAILDTLLSKGDASEHAGVIVPDTTGQPKGQVAAPLQELDQVPFPDYSDFPWSVYPNRIVPVITGRGCGWGACAFCSDITSTAGRSYRSRSPSNVLGEIAEHHHRYGVSHFVFTDLKLNSNVQLWRALIDGIQDAAPGAQWIGAVHAGVEADNGLSEADLREAARNGCTRLSTGLETGSQRIADAMKKGTQQDTVSAFLHGASAAGISCRCTMILGYPSETADDVHMSARFLEQHRGVIERVSLNRLVVITGTSLHRWLKHKPETFRGFRIVQEEPAVAQVEHRHDTAGSAEYRKAVMRLLTVVHKINARELSPHAREFEGVM